MKKNLIFLIVLAIVIQCFSFALADQGTFQYNILKGFKGFKYDDEKEKWTYQRSYSHHVDAGTISLSIYLTGTKERISTSPMLVIGILDSDTQKPIDRANSIEFNIDGNTYLYKKLMQRNSYMAAILGFEGYELVKAFTNCNTISVTVVTNVDSYTFNVNKKKFDTTLYDICNNLIETDIWNYLDDKAIDEAFEYEEQYPLIIEIKNTQKTQEEAKVKTKNVVEKKVTKTLGEGKYIVGKDIEEGSYIITCVKTSAEDYKNTLNGLGSLYDTLDSNNNDFYSSYFSALGSMATAFDEGVLVEIIGDYGDVINSFHLQKDNSRTIKLEGKVAIRISEGTCLLEKQ